MQKKRPARPVKRRPKPVEARYALQMKWSGFRELYDAYGKKFRRFYKLETLANATERLVREKDRIIAPSVKAALGSVDLASLSFELVRETPFLFYFHLRAVNAQKKQAHFTFVVGKNREEGSAAARKRHQNLELLHRRAPDRVVQPYHGGNIFLPDRHRHRGENREIYAYLTDGPTGFHVLDINRSGQFTLTEVPREGARTAVLHTFTKGDTEAIKTWMVTLTAATYGSRERDALSISLIAPGDIVVRRTARGVLTLRLAGCRQIAMRLTPAKLIDQILDAQLKWGKHSVRIAPADPDALRVGLAQAVGEEAARQWLSQYLAAVSAGKIPARNEAYLDALRERVD